MPRTKPPWKEKQIPGQQSIAAVFPAVFQKKIEKEGEKKKNEEDDERRKEKDEGKTPPEVITIHSSSVSDDATRMDDSASSPLGGPKPTDVDNVKETPFAKGEETKTVVVGRRDKRKKGGFGAPPPTTNEETTYAPSPDSAERKRGEESKKPKGYADAVKRNLENTKMEEKVPVDSKSRVSKTLPKSAVSATAVAPKTKTEKPPTSKTMELTKKGWDRDQTSALFDCAIATLYLHFRTATETATGGSLDQKAIEKYSRRHKSKTSLMPSVKEESLNNPLTRERMFHSPTAIEDKWKNVMKAVNTAETKKNLASRIFATSTKEGVESTDDMEKVIECITMMNVSDCFLTSTTLSENAPLKRLFEGSEKSAWKSLAERAKAYNARKYDDWWDQVPIAEKDVYTILNQPYAQNKSRMMPAFVNAAVHEESQRKNMVNVFSDAKKAVQQYIEAKVGNRESTNEAELNEAIALKKECMKYVFKVYERMERNAEDARTSLDQLAENPDADVGGSDKEKEFNDWVDMNVIKLWQYWALGGDEENDEKKEKLNEFFENYVEMRARNKPAPPPSSDEE